MNSPTSTLSAKLGWTLAGTGAGTGTGTSVAIATGHVVMAVFLAVLGTVLALVRILVPQDSPDVVEWTKQILAHLRVRGRDKATAKPTRMRIDPLPGPTVIDAWKWDGRCRAGRRCVRRRSRRPISWTHFSVSKAACRDN